MNRVAIIVLNWNGLNDTLTCLDSLISQSYPYFQIILIDNGSRDDSVPRLTEYVSRHANRIRFHKNPVNLGFAGGVNTGIKLALEDNFTYIALINNDAVAERQWLAWLVDCIEPSDVGIATGLLLHSDGKTIDSTGDWYSKWGLPFPRSRGENTVFAPVSGYVFGASGGATLFKTRVFKDIGLFDEDFFAYYEDIDICFRTQLAGWKVKYVSEAIAYHKQGASSRKIAGFTIYQTFKNLPLVYIKNVPSSLLIKVGLRFWTAYTLIFMNAIVHGSGWPAIKGCVFFILLLPKKLRERRSIQKNRKMTTSYIESMLWNDLPPDQTGLRRLRKKFIGK